MEGERSAIYLLHPSAAPETRVDSWFRICSGLFVALVAFLGLAGNFITILVYGTPRLRRSYYFILHLSAIELFAAGSFIFISLSAFTRSPMLPNSIGCTIDGVLVAFSAFSAIWLKALIAIRRYVILKNRRKGGDPWDWKTKTILTTLIYSLAFVLASTPLFGWSRFVPIGSGWYCCFDFTSRDFDTRLLFSLLLLLGFLAPVLILIGCYGKIFLVTGRLSGDAQEVSCCGGWETSEGGHNHGRGSKETMSTRLALNIPTTIVEESRTSGTFDPWRSTKNPHPSRDIISHLTDISEDPFMKEKRNLVRTCVAICIAFIVAWLPFACVSLITQFGPKDFRFNVRTLETVSLISKTFVVFNPIIYGISDQPFRRRIAEIRNGIFGQKVYYPSEDFSDVDTPSVI